MTTINQLSELTPLSDADALALYSSANGDTRRASLSSLKTYLTGTSTGDGKITQYSAPAASGATVTLPANSQHTWLVITPVAAYAAMTIVLPDAAFAVHNQEILVFCTQAVTTLTITATGATAFGAPATLAANDRFLLRYEATLKRWYRVG